MIAEVDFHGLGLLDLALIVGIGGYLVDRIIDAKGWSRSSKTLRRENEDLVRRNRELEETVDRHEQDIARLRGQIAELEKTNLAAAIQKLAEHEANAVLRHHENALRGEQQVAQGQQTLGLLTEIRDTLKEGARP